MGFGGFRLGNGPLADDFVAAEDRDLVIGVPGGMSNARGGIGRGRPRWGSDAGFFERGGGELAGAEDQVGRSAGTDPVLGRTSRPKSRFGTSGNSQKGNRTLGTEGKK